MSTDNKSMDVSIWEKIGDGFSAFSEGVGRFLRQGAPASRRAPGQRGDWTGFIVDAHRRLGASVPSIFI